MLTALKQVTRSESFIATTVPLPGKTAVSQKPTN